jgi:hypothetical protein
MLRLLFPWLYSAERCSELEERVERLEAELEALYADEDEDEAGMREVLEAAHRRTVQRMRH